MNRMTRRHPTHSLLPLMYPSSKRITDQRRKKSKVNPANNKRKIFRRML